MKSVKSILKNIVCGVAFGVMLVSAGMVFKEIAVWTTQLISTFVALSAAEHVFTLGICQLGLWSIVATSFRKILDSKDNVEAEYNRLITDMG